MAAQPRDWKVTFTDNTTQTFTQCVLWHNVEKGAIGIKRNGNWMWLVEKNVRGYEQIQMTEQGEDIF